jgi:hypothetical protein
MTMTEELVGTVARQAIGADQIAFGEHQISLAASRVCRFERRLPRQPGSGSATL